MWGQDGNMKSGKWVCSLHSLLIRSQLCAWLALCTFLLGFCIRYRLFFVRNKFVSGMSYLNTKVIESQGYFCILLTQYEIWGLVALCHMM